MPVISPGEVRLRDLDGEVWFNSLFLFFAGRDWATGG
jgi:hypothetical protein